MRVGRRSDRRRPARRRHLQSVVRARPLQPPLSRPGRSGQARRGGSRGNTPRVLDDRARREPDEADDDALESVDELAARIDHVDATPDSVLVLRNAGPKGGPGMPEWGQLPIPKRLLERGVTDLVRISDARMSGTAFGTVVLHDAPEAASADRSAPSRTVTRSCSTSTRSSSTSTSTRRR